MVSDNRHDGDPNPCLSNPLAGDFDNWIGFCNDDAIILFHDVESFPETVGVFFADCDGYKLIHTGSAGLGILTKSEEKYNKIKNIINA